MTETVQKILFDPTVGKIVTILIGLVVIGIFIKLLKRTVSNYITDNDTRYRTKKFINFFGYILMVILLVVIFSERLGGITVALGVAGAGIAFALQEVVASVAGWLAILFAGFYKTGDRVQLGGIKGDVIDIGILRTTLMELGQWVSGDLYNGRIVRIANSFIFKEPVFNYSADFPFLWDEITIPVKYGSDYRLAQEIFYKAAVELTGSYATFAKEAWNKIVKKYLIEDASTEPMVNLVANDNWLEYTVRYIVDYKKRRSFKNSLFLKILEEIEKTDGRVAIASATVHIVETPVFKVQLNDKE
jgi:small-conductance mechanosensitive channel